MIYVITHKIFNDSIVDNKFYQILHVGKNENCRSYYLRDDTGDNISFKNNEFCELTGLYWIWKNGLESPSEVTGIVHYRRYFTTRREQLCQEYFNTNPTILSGDTISDQLLNHDIILPVLKHPLHNVEYVYGSHHYTKDLILLRDSISSICPEYLKTFDHEMKSHSYYYANMMVCKKQVLDDYCSWLFPILFDVEKKIDVSSYDNYQKRVIGFLAERLVKVYVVHNHLRVKQYGVFNTERIEDNLVKTVFKKFK